MTDDGALAAKLAFLEACGAGSRDHSGADLLSHLRGTYDLLVEWGARPAVCEAGLFHSVYGTRAFRGSIVSPEQRQAVRDIIGTEAEDLAYLFGAINMATLYENFDRTDRFAVLNATTGEWVRISEPCLRDLCNLAAANWLEQSDRLSQELRDLDVDEHRQMLPWLLDGARHALARTLADRGGDPLGLSSSVWRPPGQ
jgi:hypothetical protein